MKERVGLRIPIVVKLVSITLALLLVATVLIAQKSSEFFEKKSGEREEDTNRDQANGKAAEVEGLVSGFVDKAKIVASLLLKEYPNDVEKQAALNLSFFADRDMVAVSVVELKDGKTETVKQVVNEEYLKQYDLKADYIANIRVAKAFPLGAVFSGSVEVRNSSIPSGAPLLTVGIPFVKDDVGKITHIAVADIRLDRIQRIFSTESDRTFFLVDKEGAVVAHPNDKLALEGKKMKYLEIVEKALAATERQGQRRYVDPEVEEMFIGAFSKTTMGLSVIAQIAVDVILEPARNVKREAFYITGMVLSGALFLVFIFSISLTGPIERLFEMATEIGKGNFSVRSDIGSWDEVGDLGRAFDDMAVGLEERERAMNVLSKTQGADVAQTLMDQDLDQMGGTKKRVAVLFSDLRDFTKFSEGHSPEEVVEMLNEYFEQMVGCIERNQGRVNKFIGDAIMAMWGAPSSTGQDEYLATKAAFDMRVELNKLNDLRISRNQPPIKIGVGVHCGEAVAGTIGSKSRLEYTIIGDTVNMASRIEASTKAFGADLLLSHEMMEKVQDKFVVEFGGAAEVKGKAEALRMYKVRGYFDESGAPVLVQTPYSDYKAESADKVKVQGAPMPGEATAATPIVPAPVEELPVEEGFTNTASTSDTVPNGDGSSSAA